MNNKTLLITALILTALGYGFGRYLQPAKVITKEVIIEKQVDVVKRDVTTKIKEITNKDGSKITETVIEDRSKETSKKESETNKSTVVINTKPQWRVQGTAKLNKILTPIYGAGIERRILGPVSGGIFANTDKEYGVSLSFEF